MENKYIKNYKQFDTAYGKSSQINNQLTIGKHVTLQDDREAIIYGLSKKEGFVKVSLSGKIEEVTITDIK